MPDHNVESGWRYTLLLGVIAIFGRILLLPILPHPTPLVHDEFSYIFGGETFAAGKLSSDPHPQAQFFETFHVLSWPKYMSKYPPGQAAFLAIGILLGHPHNGVILSFGLFVMATVWLLRSVVPLKWALFGGVWMLLTFNVHSYWLESYWGGFVGAIGGNLLLGSLLYSLQCNEQSARWWFAPGALVLSVTRPFEGLVFVVVTLLVFFGWQWFANRQRFAKTARVWAAPFLLATGLVAIVAGAYNVQTLGAPLHFPYLEYEKQYGMMPSFWPLQFRNEIRFNDHTMERFYREYSAELYNNSRAHFPLVLLLPVQMLRIAKFDVLDVFGYSTGAIVLALFCWRSTTMRILALALIGTIFVLSFEVLTLPHYLAPVTGLLIALGVCSLKETHDKFRNAGRTPWLVCSLFALVLVAPVIHSGRYVYAANREGIARGVPDYPIQYKETPRDAIKRRLAAMGGMHVVFIRYSPTHDVHDEWVYNSPDIDSQRVIWARDRGEENRKLEAYYPSRTFWLVEADSPSPQTQRLRAPEMGQIR